MAAQAEVLEGRKRREALVIRHQLRHLKEIMVALALPPLAAVVVGAQVKQAILTVFVMVVTALHLLLLERLFSMLAEVAVALSQFQLQPPEAMAVVELETVETVLLLQQGLQTQAVAVVVVGIREPLAVLAS